MDDTERHAQNEVPTVLLDWLSRESRPRLLVTRDLEILWTNRSAHSALSKERDLANRDGRLTTINPIQQKELGTFVGEAHARASKLALPCTEGKGHLLLSARRVGANRAQERVGIIFFRSHQAKPDYADFEQIFGLSRAEHQVLLLMLDGKTAEEVATAKNVGIATVRFQIKKIYCKLGASSREGLFRRVRPYVF